MQIAGTVKELAYILSKRGYPQLGFVPTMGALHQGHISLIQASKLACDITLCSIFVNPTQFNDPVDFEKYPVTAEADIEMLKAVDCDILFLPDVNEVYPQGTRPSKLYSLGNLERILEGKYRPGHFQGVCQVMDRLLNIVVPDTLFMGEKDYQQGRVVQHILSDGTIPFPVKLIIVPTKREINGLAISSRNIRIPSEDLTTAAVLYQTLQFIQENLHKGNLPSLTDLAVIRLLKAGFEKVDYIAIARAESLELIKEWNGRDKIVILGAAFLNGVRLIDNIPVPIN